MMAKVCAAELASTCQVVVAGDEGLHAEEGGDAPLVGLGDVVDRHEVREEAEERGERHLDGMVALVGGEYKAMR